LPAGEPGPHQEPNPVPRYRSQARPNHARTRVLLLVQDLHVRVVNAATGELLRELTIDPARDDQPIHPPRAKTTPPQTHTEVRGDASLLRDHTGAGEGIRTLDLSITSRQAAVQRMPPRAILAAHVDRLVC
jgi:hypothetical protein